MIAKKQIAIAMLSALALAAAAVSSTKNPVERPALGYASAKWVFQPDGSATTEQTGVASFGGAFTMTGSGPSGSTVSGVATAANGDQIFWKTTPGGPFQVTITGGTGRFEGATGGINETWESERIFTFYPDGSMTMEVTYTFAGSITY